MLLELNKDTPFVNIFNNFDYLNYFITFDKGPEEFREGEDIHRIISVDELVVSNTADGETYFIKVLFTTKPMKEDFPNVRTKSLIGVNLDEVLQNNKLKIHTKLPMFSIDTYSVDKSNGISLNDKTVLKPIAEETKTFGDYFAGKTLELWKSAGHVYEYGNFLQNPTNPDKIPKSFYQGDNYVALPLNVTKNSNEEVRFYSR
jgi:hypothetical protein